MKSQPHRIASLIVGVVVAACTRDHDQRVLPDPPLGTVSSRDDIIAGVNCSSSPTVTAYPAGDFVEGYVSHAYFGGPFTPQQSFAPGDTIQIHASARSGTETMKTWTTNGDSTGVTATYYQLVGTKPFAPLADAVAAGAAVQMAQRTGVPVMYQGAPVDASECGARWDEVTGLEISVPTDGTWRSGLYAVKLSLDARPDSVFEWVPFIVTPSRNAGVTTPWLVIANTNTWAAYNSWPLHVSQRHPCSGTCACNKGFGPTANLYGVGDHTTCTGGWYDSSTSSNGHSYYQGAQQEYLSFLRPNLAADPGIDIPLTAGHRGSTGDQAFLDVGTYPATQSWGRGYSHLVMMQREALDWLYRQEQTAFSGYTHSVIADTDYGFINLADASVVRTIFIPAHNEYWTADMLNAIDAYLRRGGHVMGLTGDTADWRVQYNTQGDQMRAPSRFRSPYEWQHPDFPNAPVNFQDGIVPSFTLGTLDRALVATPAYLTVGDPQHWLFAGFTGLSAGEPIGTGGGDFAWPADLWSSVSDGTTNYAYGWETDCEPANGTPDDVSSVRAAPAYTTGTYAGGVTYVGKGHGGGVFNGNSVNFAQALDLTNAGCSDAAPSACTDSDPNLTRLVRNALQRFNKRVPAAPGDFTGATTSDPAFYSDFWCHGSSSSSSQGKTWVGAVRGDLSTAGAHSSQWTGSWCGGSGDVFGIGDFNGDRRVDSYCYHSGAGTVEVAFSDGTSALTSQGTWLTSYTCSGTGYSLVVGDVNGDGFDDLICHNSSSFNGMTSVALSNGSSAFSNSNWTAAATGGGHGWCTGTGATFGTGDFNGDGLADVWCHYMTNVSPAYGATYIQLSDGVSSFVDPYKPSATSQCNPADTDTCLAWLPSGWCTGATTGTGNQFGAADLNGDGISDFYCHSSTYGTLYLAFGRGQYQSSAPSDQPVGGFRWPYTTSSAGQSPNSNLLSSGSWCTGTGALFGVGDFNGDGRADIYCRVSSGATYVRLISVTWPTSGVDHPYWQFQSNITAFSSWCAFSGAEFGSASPGQGP